ncbi:MAG: amidohydrolase family protein [Gammaproteobacteria bacterium]|nr:amidohydrolase family protein [Gammaproteobacteria bacterium]
MAVGKLADFVVLSDDLLTIDPDDIKDVTVVKTFVGGEEIYSAD